MFFMLSKIVWALISPLTFICVVLGIGGFLRFFDKTKSLAHGLIKHTLILFLLLSILPIGYNIQVFLERQTIQPVLTDSPDYGGIIVLGGCMNAGLSHFYQMPHINGSCERLLEGITLHKHFPDLPFIYSGGSGHLINQDYRGADAAKRVMENLGVETESLIFERNSRNTYENMDLSLKLLGSPPEKPWILVTFRLPHASCLSCILSGGVECYALSCGL